MDYAIFIPRPNCPAMFAPEGSPSVALDTVAGNLVTGAVSVNDVSLTVAANSNRMLVAMIDNTASRTVSSVAYTAGSGGAWTLLGSAVTGGGNDVEIWYSSAPSTGAITVRTTYSGTMGAFDGNVVLYSLYNATTPTTYTSDVVGTSPTISLSLSAGGMMLGECVANGALTPVLTGTQDYDNSSNDIHNAAHNTGSGSVTITWTGAANARGINACAVPKA